MSSIILIIVMSLVALIVFLWLVPLNLWFQCVLNGVKMSLLQLIFMRWRKVPPAVIVNSMITSKKAGLELSSDLLEAHYLAGGHVPRVVKALISADKANINLDFKSAAAIDLAGRDVFEAVQLSVNPKVLEIGRASCRERV